MCEVLAKQHGQTDRMTSLLSDVQSKAAPRVKDQHALSTLKQTCNSMLFIVNRLRKANQGMRPGEVSVQVSDITEGSATHMAGQACRGPTTWLSPRCTRVESLPKLVNHLQGLGKGVP